MLRLRRRKIPWCFRPLGRGGWGHKESLRARVIKPVIADRGPTVAEPNLAGCVSRVLEYGRGPLQLKADGRPRARVFSAEWLVGRIHRGRCVCRQEVARPMTNP